MGICRKTPTRRRPDLICVEFCSRQRVSWRQICQDVYINRLLPHVKYFHMWSFTSPQKEKNLITWRCPCNFSSTFYSRFFISTSLLFNLRLKLCSPYHNHDWFVESENPPTYLNLHRYIDDGPRNVLGEPNMSMNKIWTLLYKIMSGKKKKHYYWRHVWIPWTWTRTWRVHCIHKKQNGWRMTQIKYRTLVPPISYPNHSHQSNKPRSSSVHAFMIRLIPKLFLGKWQENPNQTHGIGPILSTFTFLIQPTHMWNAKLTIFRGMRNFVTETYQIVIEKWFTFGCFPEC